MTIASEQLRSIVDRILRLKAEQDDLAADIREIYAEAKGNGYDKTALGQLVSYIRKRDKDPEKFAEGNAVFDLYLTAYENSDVHVNHPEKINDFSCAHTHEAETDFEPDQTSKSMAVHNGAGKTGVTAGRDPQSEPPADIPPLPAFLRRDKQARAV